MSYFKLKIVGENLVLKKKSLSIVKKCWLKCIYLFNFVMSMIFSRVSKVFYEEQ